jgi:hypothetical protein
VRFLRKRSSWRSAISVAGVGDFGDQHQLGGRTRLLEPEVVLERGVAQAAHAAEKVELNRNSEPAV